MNQSVLHFGNDITFALPAIALAQAWSVSPISGVQAFLYHFNCPNPWEGPWKGHASHVLDIAFALQNYRDRLSSGQRQCAERLARDIIHFVNGNEPWKQYEQSANAESMIYFAPAEGDEDESRLVSDQDTELTSRRDILQRLAKGDMLDKVMDAWLMFMSGPRQL